MDCGGDFLRTDAVNDDVMRGLLMALTPANRLAILVSMTTGLRIGDVLAIKTAQVQKGKFGIVEGKTGKRRQVRLSSALQQQILGTCAGKVWAFPGRLHPHTQHRTRQAVYKDLRRAADLFRLPAGLIVAPHSARKIYAVREYRRTCDIRHVQRLLNHSSEAVTMLYAMADQITARHLTDKQQGKVGGI